MFCIYVCSICSNSIVSTLSDHVIVTPNAVQTYSGLWDGFKIKFTTNEGGTMCLLTGEQILNIKLQGIFFFFLDHMLN